MNNVEQLTFEEALGKLEAIVLSLEQGEIELEEALALYEQGTRLAQRCANVLDAAELRVQQLPIAQEGQQRGIFPDDNSG